MTAPQIKSMTFEAFCHATEDLGMVEHSIYNLVPSPFHGSLHLTVQNVVGHFKNPIAILRGKLVEQNALTATIRHMSERISEIDKRVLSQSLRSRIDDKGVLHIRFDKQDLFHGHLALTDSDDVVLVKIQPHHGVLRASSVDEAYRLLGLIL